MTDTQTQRVQAGWKAGSLPKVPDEGFDNGDEDIASPKPLPSRTITPSEVPIWSSGGVLMAMRLRGSVGFQRIYATHRAMLYFVHTR